jgi:hypothetical protein
VTIEALTGLLNTVVWPAVVVFAVILLRRELTALFGRVREIEGPGSLKVILDPNKVEQIIKDGQNDSPATVAKRIVRTATILDRREARILRALFDDDGRAIYSYQNDFYRPALESLLVKEYIRKANKGFALTPMGLNVTKEYILGVVQGLETAKPEQPNATTN